MVVVVVVENLMMMVKVEYKKKWWGVYVGSYRVYMGKGSYGIGDGTVGGGQ